MSEIKYVSFAIVVIGPGRDRVGATVETAQYWEPMRPENRTISRMRL